LGFPFLLAAPGGSSTLAHLRRNKLDTMVRLLFWIALIAAAFWLWRKFKAGNAASSSNAPQDTTLKMVRCAHCGVHLPNDRALHRGNEWYCSTAHLEQGPSDKR